MEYWLQRTCEIHYGCLSLYQSTPSIQSFFTCWDDSVSCICLFLPAASSNTLHYIKFNSARACKSVLDCKYFLRSGHVELWKITIEWWVSCALFPFLVVLQGLTFQVRMLTHVAPFFFFFRLDPYCAQECCEKAHLHIPRSIPFSPAPTCEREQIYRCD